MALQPPNLVAQRIPRDRFGFLVPLRPVFPLIAAAPARHHENAHLIGEVEEVVVLQFAFQAHRVEVEIADVVELGLLPLRRGSQQQVEAVSSPSDQNILAIDLKYPVPLLVNVRCNLADSEADMRCISTVRSSG